MCAIQPLVPTEGIGPIFAAQQGLATSSQLLDAGITRSSLRSLVSSGWIERVHRGVYRSAGSPQTWKQELMAAQLACGDGSWISHRSAAALHDLTGFLPGPVELSTVRDRRKVAGATVFRASQVPYFRFVRIGSFVVAEVNLTLLNLAAVDQPAQVEEALDDAVARNLTSVAKLDWFLTRCAGKGVPGSKALRNLLGCRQPREEVPQSRMESRMDRLIRRGRLPQPIRQCRVMNERGEEVARPDFAYPDQKLSIECQSYRWHSGRRTWHHDLDRSNSLTRLGWRTLYFTWEQIRDDPDIVIERIREALGCRRLPKKGRR
jgi:very-short-patch-repair endonuclease